MDVPSLNDFETRFHDPIWIAIAEDICRESRLEFHRITRAKRGENIVLFVDDEFVLKIYTPKKNGFNREREALEFIKGRTSLPVAEIIECGEYDGFEYLITDHLPGRSIKRDQWLTLRTPEQIALLTQLASGLREMHSQDATGFRFNWNEFINIQLESVLDRQRREGGNPEWLESLPAYIETYLPLLPQHRRSVFLHGDVHFGNICVTDDLSQPVISGLFDFADSLTGFHEYEFVAIGVLMIQGQGDLQRELFRAYGYKESEINVDMRRRLMLLTILYEHSSLRRYAERLERGSEMLTLEELEKAIWNFI
jgi:hygromycin-B 7''-O-kinase